LFELLVCFVLIYWCSQKKKEAFVLACYSLLLTRAMALEQRIDGNRIDEPDKKFEALQKGTMMIF